MDNLFWKRTERMSWMEITTNEKGQTMFQGKHSLIERLKNKFVLDTQ